MLYGMIVFGEIISVGILNVCTVTFSPDVYDFHAFGPFM